MSNAKQSPPKGKSKGRRGGLMVVSADGGRQRFLRGMITHALVERGVDFDQSYAIARAVRDRVGDRDEVTTAELGDLVEEQLAALFVDRPRPQGRPRRRPASPITVAYHGKEQPFSRGVLATSIHAAGIDLDRAYRLVTDLEANLVGERIKVIRSGEIARRVGDLLERLESADDARRYRLVRRIHRLSKPLVIYLGGASGTGKSRLALDLAPLLRIYRVNATDTIRQVMRMVFTPAILPSIHRSSFELSGTESGDERSLSAQDPHHAQQLLDDYREQATRVCVGVRAVVERAITENLSLVVEGVHLHPDLVPFPDLEGGISQVSIFLATLDYEAHRTRFLSRSLREKRQADRYLEHFGAIRIIHDHILELAEANDVPLLDTSKGDATVPRALRVVTGMLEKSLPAQISTQLRDLESPVLLLIVDGMADGPVHALGGRTPLQAARTPTFDRLARDGQTGLADPVAPGVVGDTATGTLALFGQSPLTIGRGPAEAAGAGLTMDQGDVALRGNLATLGSDGNLLDRRAGRIRIGVEELARAIDRLPLGNGFDDIEVRVAPATEHRLAIVLHGPGLSDAIAASDPGEAASPGPPLTPRPLHPGDAKAARTALALAAFEAAAAKVLTEHPINAARVAAGMPPANAILTRGAGHRHELIPLEVVDGQALRLACVSGDSIVLGIASRLGATTIRTAEMTANLDTNLDAKMDAAETALATSDLVAVHVKGADIAGHDRRPDLKVEFLERVDTALGLLLDRHTGDLRVAIACDHATLSESGHHSSDPIPVLICGPGHEPDAVTTFDEASVATGSLGRIPLQALLGRLFPLA